MNEPYAKDRFYHLFNRGCNREDIFFSQKNYEYLLRKVKATHEKYGAGIVAYCLMPNHYHFLLQQQTERPLSDWIQQLFNGYTQAVNKERGRSGTLFQGRTRRVLLETDEQLIHVARYIHANPVVAGLAERPEEWAYSNYLEWIEARPGTLVLRELVKCYFPTPDHYREFVADYFTGKTSDEKFRAFYLD